MDPASGGGELSDWGEVPGCMTEAREMDRSMEKGRDLVHSASSYYNKIVRMHVHCFMSRSVDEAMVNNIFGPWM